MLSKQKDQGSSDGVVSMGEGEHVPLLLRML